VPPECESATRNKACKKRRRVQKSFRSARIPPTESRPVDPGGAGGGAVGRGGGAGGRGGRGGAGPELCSRCVFEVSGCPSAALRRDRSSQQLGRVGRARQPGR